MRIIFMGTPEFALPSLKILLAHQYNIVAVATSPDKPQGRGQKLAPSPVKELALAYNLRVLQPEDLRAPDFVSTIAQLQPDLIVVVAFRILPREVFTVPRLGSFNLHASLLPRYRGAAPIQWALINGEEETGVTTFLLQEKVDTGSILLQARVRVGPDDTAGELHDRLADLGAQVVLQTVRLIELGSAQPYRQDDSLASLAPKIFKEDCSIEWKKSAREIHNFVRGLSPLPCAWTTYGGKTLRIYRTILIDPSASADSEDVPGTLVRVEKDLVLVQTGRGLISIIELQQEGRRRMKIAEFLRGHELSIGERLR
jgi:methionyl-tRNA formyltransferase